MTRHYTSDCNQIVMIFFGFNSDGVIVFLGRGMQKPLQRFSISTSPCNKSRQVPG